MKILMLFFSSLALFVFSGCSSISGVEIPSGYEEKLPKDIRIVVPEIDQDDHYSCATTSLAMVMSYYENKEYSKDEVWDSSGSNIVDVTQRCGNDMNGLRRAASEYGYEKYEFVQNMKLNELKYLVSKDIPVVINIKNFYKDSYHAVVVVGYDESGIWFNDPAGGSLDYVDYEDLKKNWYANLCSPMRGKATRSAFILYRK